MELVVVGSTGPTPSSLQNDYIYDEKKMDRKAPEKKAGKEDQTVNVYIQKFYNTIFINKFRSFDELQ